MRHVKTTEIDWYLSSVKKKAL